MDDPSFRLIVQLQLEDALALKASRPSTRGTADSDQAIELYEEELRRLATFNNDRVMATSIGRAIDSDITVLQGCEAQNEMAVRDHRLAMDVARGVVNLDVPQNNRGNDRVPANGLQAPVNRGAGAGVPNGPGLQNAQPPANRFGGGSGGMASNTQAPVNRIEGPSGLPYTPPYPSPAYPRPSSSTFGGFGTSNNSQPSVNRVGGYYGLPSRSQAPGPINRSTATLNNRTTTTANTQPKMTPPVGRGGHIQTPARSSVAMSPPTSARSSVSGQVSPASSNTLASSMTPEVEIVPASGAGSLKRKATDSLEDSSSKKGRTSVDSEAATSTAIPSSVSTSGQLTTINHWATATTGGTSQPGMASKKRKATDALDDQAAKKRRVSAESTEELPSPPPTMEGHPAHDGNVTRPVVKLPPAKPLAEEPSTSVTANSNKRKASEMIELVECCTCNEEFETTEIFDASCGDKYCRSCIRQLFRLTLTDQSLFPPKCCRQEITVESVGRFLGPELVKEYLEKKLEYVTPNPVYCSNTECLKFVPPARVINDIGTCECGTRTCKICKKAAHNNQNCPDDAPLQQTLQLAEQQGWKQCHVCHRMIELTVGCHHIT